jgi:branched-chain amino acid transport system substrate-binding protein
VKKWLPLTAVVVLCLALVVGVACGGGGDGDGDGGVKEVKFGWGLPLTGIYGAVFLPAKQALEIANEYIGEFTIAGEQYKWDLIFEDNGWDAEGGVASATKLIFDDGVNMMFQIGGDPAMAAQTICEQSGVILFTSAIPMDAFGPDKPHTFLGQTNVWCNTAALFKYINEAHPEVQTASSVNEDTSTGHEMTDAIAGAVEYYGLEWLAPEFYLSGTTEFYPIATKMVSKDPDLCYADLRNVQPMRELGWEGTAVQWIWGPAYVDRYGSEANEGYLIYYPAPYGEGLPEAMKGLAAEYEDRYGAEFSQTAYFYPIMLYLMTDALKKAGTVDDVDQIIATLEAETFDTPVGPVKFGLEELDGIGHLMVMPCWVGEIRDGEYQLVFEMSTDEAEAVTTEVFGK